ncbi:MAG: YwiC-like family protein [Actinobacteria bacterium]|nr:YwiC-like family protein [Actinomycetota bacterium]
MPTEHGGWGLTLEPVVLGLLVAPSVAGACIASAVVVAFLARTPLRIVLVDLRRHRWLPRSTTALAVFAMEATVLATFGAVALVRTDATTWWPLAAMAPFIAIELAYDARSRSRRLVPELAGAVGVGGAVALVALAGGASSSIATAAWLLLAARALTSIPTVRDQVAGLHGRPRDRRRILLFDGMALATAGVAVVVTRSALLGAATIVAVIAVQHLLEFWPAPRAAILGARQSMLGGVLVIAAAIGLGIG